MYGQLSNLYLCLELDFEGLPPWLPRCFNEWLLLCLLRCRSRCLWSPVFGLWSPRRPKIEFYFFTNNILLKKNNSNYYLHLHPHHHPQRPLAPNQTSLCPQIRLNPNPLKINMFKQLKSIVFSCPVSCSWHQTTKSQILFSPIFSTKFSQFKLP